ncbi:class I SAM-dependent methyltransferase [Rhodanobacter sp. MP7CTX1]|jgi:predicted methyltransferase|uniref:class I SAM-dependent methyltransferase n=1 Tax=Rhodanobacter sp. MP7CTX1 TaxID=2723084 RepID=UPI00162116D1|nr:class I SAM-dependent methyltransferase [Rhodanobacter sp. MP7CTX1]MBB6186855.1 putative methyltransferase [Rhodanobacter sp. MP7CTX1]
MKLNSLFVVAVVFAAGASMPVQAASEIPAYITAAVADAGRPPEDKAQDANRKPAEVLAFAGIKPGDKVVDLMPGSGYYTRIFSKIVGPKGVVYALQPAEMDKVAPKRLQSLKTFAGKRGYANVVILVQPVAAIAIPERVDMVWTSQNYHDLHDPFMDPANMARIDKSIFDALKPGGIFLVLDHAATPGSGISDTNTLHRIDPAAAKMEVTAAGFELVGDSDILRNPDDNHSLPIFDKSIKGKTDKFIEKFRKPMQ